MDLPRQPALPFSEESERAVLGGILLDPEALCSLAQKLSGSDFYLERHRLIWQAMTNLLAAGVTVDIRTLQADLQQRARLEAVGGVSYLAELDADLPDIGRLGQYAEIIRERSIRRQLIQAASDTIWECLDGGLAGTEAAAAALQRVSVIERDAAGSRAYGRGLGDVLADVQEELVRTQEAGIDLTTGFPALDALTSGLERTGLTIIGGRPSMGKTSLALQIAYRNATRGKVVCFRSCESSDKSLGKRLLSQVTGVDFGKIRQPWRLSPEEHRNIATTAEGLASLPFVFESDPQKTDYRDICSWVRREAAARGRVDLVVGDFLQLVDGPEKDMRLKLDAACAAFKKLAADLNCHVIWLSQLSRPPLGRADNRPLLQDLKESGGIEAAADLVLFPYRPRYFDASEPETLAEVNVAKQRDGPAGPDVVARLEWDGRCIRFR